MNVSKPTLHPGVQLTRRWVVEYFNGQNEQAAREFIAPAYTLEIGDHVFAGRDTQWLPAVAQQFAQFPGMGMTVHGLVVGSDRKAHHVGVWFSEHGASGGAGGRTSVWTGIALYAGDGRRLSGCVAVEDYHARRRQLTTGLPDPVPPPALAPRPLPTIIAVGVARPSAQGQAMTRTATALTSAGSNSPRQPHQ